jgi:hypothetical protein
MPRAQDKFSRLQINYDPKLYGLCPILLTD